MPKHLVSDEELTRYLQSVSLDELVDSQLPVIMYQRVQCDTAESLTSTSFGGDPKFTAKLKKAEKELEETQTTLLEHFTKAGGTKEQLEKMILDRILYSPGPYLREMRYNMD